MVQYKVLWFQVSVDNAFGMQVSKSLHHTSCVKPGCGVFKRTPKDKTMTEIKDQKLDVYIDSMVLVKADVVEKKFTGL